MKKFETKRHIRSKIYSKFTLVSLLILFILLARGVYSLYLKNNESLDMRRDAELRLKSILSRKDTIGKEIEKLSSDEGVENEIREKFNVVKPGEKVVIIVPEEVATSTEEEKGFFKSLWHKISDN